jgi:primosomal protein N' (replication factor Y)
MAPSSKTSLALFVSTDMLRSVDNANVQDLFPEPIAGWATVAVDRPIDVAGRGLTWAIPEELADLATGERVVVPLGRRGAPTTGWIVDIQLSPPEPLPKSWKFVLKRHGGPRLPDDLMTLGLWIARYYLAAPGPTLTSMVPAAVQRNTGSVQRRLLQLADDADPSAATGAGQRAVLAAIASIEPNQLPIERGALRTLADIRTYGPIDRLVDRGVLTQELRAGITDRWSMDHLHTPPTPTPTATQQGIIEAVAAAFEDGFSTHLLLGVTGSGKTEVYLRLIERVLAQGRTALMLVPEIALTPQTGARLAARFPDQEVAILHSALPGATRHARWDAIATGRSRVVLGARSAIFAPIPSDQLGLVIVDEEHDGSYKQDASPRYHGRDVAIRRAHLAGCPVLLGSATPSLESWHNATTLGRSTLHRLPTRAPGLQVPTIRVVDMLQQRREGMPFGTAISPPLHHALAQTLDQGHQALLLLNRRGWATWISCRTQKCGWVMECDHCDATMVFHRRGDVPTGGYLRCHHCQSEIRIPRVCPDCGGGIARLGTGVQRIEDDLLHRYPSLTRGNTLCRVDSDSMNSARDFHDVLGRFQQGDVRVLLGTQMIAKGLDVPGVRLVGVIDADTALHMPDFRAGERTFQLISQVTGRCGRGSGGGLAIVQTLAPETPPIQMAVAGNYEQFADDELAQRQGAALPPQWRMARVLAQHPDLEVSRGLIDRVAAGFKAIAPSDGVLIGPAPCTFPRLRGRYRFDLLLTCPQASGLQRWLHQAASERLLGDRAIAVDVDPTGLG